MLSLSHLTDTGVKRDHNEDFYIINEEMGLFVVCDGMGGHAAGEVASEMACKGIEEFIKENFDSLSRYQKEFTPENRQKVHDLLDKAIQHANLRIYKKAQKEKDKKGMGTTLVMGLQFPQGLFIAHVGDSRAYMIRKGKLKQLTEDHSLVNEMIQSGMISKEEAFNHPQGNIITKALGIQRAVVGTSNFFEIMDGDAVFFCSDGLGDYLKEVNAITIYKKNKVEDIAPAFIKFANDKGGKDNITCVCLQFGNKDAPPAHPAMVTADSKVQTLKKIPLFSSLNYKELSQILEVCHVMDIPKEKIIIREGEMGDDMFVILKGDLSVIYEESEVNILKPGQFFGEMALIDKSKRSATIRTKHASKLLKIDREELFALLKKEARIGVKVFWAFLQNMNKRLRENDKKVFEMTTEKENGGEHALPQIKLEI